MDEKFSSCTQQSCLVEHVKMRRNVLLLADHTQQRSLAVHADST
jgi:hypothetical protein